MLVVRTESSPSIHLLLKFLLPMILSFYLVQIRHLSFVTYLIPAAVSVSQSSHDILCISRSNELTQFLRVSYLTFLCFDDGWESSLDDNVLPRFIAVEPCDPIKPLTGIKKSSSEAVPWYERALRVS